MSSPPVIHFSVRCLPPSNLVLCPEPFGSVLDFEQNWESGKFQLARWSEAQLVPSSVALLAELVLAILKFSHNVIIFLLNTLNKNRLKMFDLFEKKALKMEFSLRKWPSKLVYLNSFSNKYSAAVDDISVSNYVLNLNGCMYRAVWLYMTLCTVVCKCSTVVCWCGDWLYGLREYKITG